MSSPDACATVTVRASRKRAAPLITCTPSAVKRGKALDGIVGRNRRNHLVDVGVDAREIDLDPARHNAEHLPASNGMRVPRRRNQRF
jgi:hypothetical protein